MQIVRGHQYSESFIKTKWDPLIGLVTTSIATHPNELHIVKNGPRNLKVMARDELRDVSTCWLLKPTQLQYPGLYATKQMWSNFFCLERPIESTQTQSCSCFLLISGSRAGILALILHFLLHYSYKMTIKT